MMRPLMGLVLLGWFSILGCGSGGPTRTQADLDRGKQLLTTALESWKKNEPESKLSSGADAITFSDDFRRTRSLLEFEIGASSVPDPRSIAYTVTIKTRDKKNHEEKLTVTYLVELSTPVRVSRDPYN